MGSKSGWKVKVDQCGSKVSSTCKFRAYPDDPEIDYPMCIYLLDYVPSNINRCSQEMCPWPLKEESDEDISPQ